jgi:DNA-binding CsgD family transcriptional regulator
VISQDALDRRACSNGGKVHSPVSPIPRPDEITELHELRADIDRVLGSLTPREALIVRRYYGFEGDDCSYDELGAQLGISGGRIHQILAKALRKLRHPSRCRILQPHVALEIRQKIEMAEKADEEIKEAECAEQRAEVLRQAEERQASDERRRRIGDEIGSPSVSRWSDVRRQDISEVLAQVTDVVVTEVHSTTEVFHYFHDHMAFSWKVYEAWKRDVRRRLLDTSVTLIRGYMADGSYLVYAREDQRTWYLFDIDYGPTGRECRWVGYNIAPHASPTGRLRGLDQSMYLRISWRNP